MAVAGSLTYDTKIDKSGFEKGINNLKSSTGNAFSQIKNIVAGLGIDKLISASFNIIFFFRFPYNFKLNRNRF